MTQSFGGRSPLQQQRMRRRLLIAISGLGTVVMLLFFAVTYLVLARESAGGSELAAAAVPAEQVRPQIEVLVAARRIEAGTRLNAGMFVTASYDAGRVPLDIIPAPQITQADGRYAARLIHAGLPLSRNDISERIPFDQLPIPPGFRAVSIQGNQRELVDGYVVPNSRVDVLFHYRDQRGRQKVKTLVSFVKVLSVEGTVHQVERAKLPNSGATATLLVSTTDAQRIELARRMGELTLALRGSIDSNAAEPQLHPVDECDVTGDCSPAARSGYMEVPDARSGRLHRYVLENNSWRRDAEDQLP